MRLIVHHHCERKFGCRSKRIYRAPRIFCTIFYHHPEVNNARKTPLAIKGATSHGECPSNLPDTPKVIEILHYQRSLYQLEGLTSHIKSKDVIARLRQNRVRNA